MAGLKARKVPATTDLLKHLKGGKNIEEETAEETSEVLKQFNKRHHDEQDRMKYVLDSEYWFCVCFQSRDQKERFLAAMDWAKHGDKYLDGTELAKQNKIELPNTPIKFVTQKSAYSEVPRIGGDSHG